MLRKNWFEPLLDFRDDERPVHPEHRPGPRPRGLGLRRPIGHALIELGRLIAADSRPSRPPQRRRAY